MVYITFMMIYITYMSVSVFLTNPPCAPGMISDLSRLSPVIVIEPIDETKHNELD